MSYENQLDYFDSELDSELEKLEQEFRGVLEEKELEDLEEEENWDTGELEENEENDLQRDLFELKKF